MTDTADKQAGAVRDKSELAPDVAFSSMEKFTKDLATIK